jgi:hypothetical protein
LIDSLNRENGEFMKLTIRWLKKQSACSGGIEWFKSQKENDSVGVVKALIADDKLDWANWLIVRIMDYADYVRYAVYAAEQVIELYEKKYPDDKRPREAIEAAKKCIDNPSKENNAAAYAAYAAANAAANAAAYAAANAAAYAAANAAAYAAYAAANAAANAAAYAAANAAAYAAANAAAYAAYAEMKLKILNYSLSLIEKSE